MGKCKKKEKARSQGGHWYGELQFLKNAVYIKYLWKTRFLKLSFAFETFILKSVFSVFLVDER